MKEALLYSTNPDTKEVHCLLCQHYCKIRDLSGGICRVRFNHNGVLYSYTYGKVDGLAIDPIEKKPFYHFKPKSRILSFGTPGCNFKCANCQNSYLSQSIKLKPENLLKTEELTPSNVIKVAERNAVDGISYTYSEPTIFFEYARDIIHLAKNTPATSHLVHLFVSNGYFSREMLEIVEKERLLDAINIDLKFFNERKYLKITGGHLDPVLENIRLVHQMGIHIEVINLVIPGENDTRESYEQIAEFIAGISPNIPLHYSRFYPQYKMLDKIPTPLETLIEAREIAKSYGLHYVYIGNTNLPDAENTYCPKCNFLVVSRQRYFTETHYKNDNEIAKCPNCKTTLNFVI